MDCLCCLGQNHPHLPNASLKAECKQLDGRVVPGAPVVLTVSAAASGGNRLPVCSLRALLASRYYAGMHRQLWRMLLPRHFRERGSYRKMPLAVSFRKPNKERQRGSNEKHRSWEGQGPEMPSVLLSNSTVVQ